MSDLLHYEVSGKPTSRLNDDGPTAISRDGLHHGREALAGIDSVSTFDRLISELLDDLVPGPFGERLDASALAFSAVFVLGLGGIVPLFVNSRRG
jgi:hypothetical protein